MFFVMIVVDILPVLRREKRKVGKVRKRVKRLFGQSGPAFIIGCHIMFLLDASLHLRLLQLLVFFHDTGLDDMELTAFLMSNVVNKRNGCVIRLNSIDYNGDP